MENFLLIKRPCENEEASNRLEKISANKYPDKGLFSSDKLKNEFINIMNKTNIERATEFLFNSI